MNASARPRGSLLSRRRIGTAIASCARDALDLRRIGALLALFALTACATLEQPRAEGTLEPVFGTQSFLTPDGYRLPYDRHGPQRPRAVVVALHGFTEHRGVHRRLGEVMAEHGIAVYAYDQRGFGETRYRGIWPGIDALKRDARTTLALVQARYPDRPVHLLGESMGGAVAMLATADDAGAPTPESLILLAPAVWGREGMPWYQRSALWVGELLTPGLRFNPVEVRRIADIQPTNDPEVIAEMQTDERMLREVRTDMLVGMTDLMDGARAATDVLGDDTLILYGLEDEIIPPEATCSLLRRIEARERPWPTVAIYPDGYHLLTRDLQRHRVLGDIVAWIEGRAGRLPSGNDQPVAVARHQVCATIPAPPKRITIPPGGP